MFSRHVLAEPGTQTRVILDPLQAGSFDAQRGAGSFDPLQAGSFDPLQAGSFDAQRGAGSFDAQRTFDDGT
jgi:hypothetical protein